MTTRLRICLASFWAAILTAVSAPAMGAIMAEKLVDLPGGDFSTQMYTSIQRAPGRPNDLFVSRADGKIYRVDLTTNTQSLFMQLPTADYAVGGGYWGLLGFTFAPDFASSGNVYVHVADDRTANPPAPPPSVHHSIYIRRYQLTNPQSNAPAFGAATNILKWDQHGADHSGGWIGFQPGDANTLWISSGDGGNAEGDQRDLKRTGQDPTDLLGSILRVNVSGSGAGLYGNYSIPANNPYKTGVGGAPEVWSIGLRSPWGGSFDRQTGDFFIGDVGSSQIGGNTGQEEVDFERADSPGGRNYGWRVMEGTTYPATQDPGAPPKDDPRFTPPVYDYPYGGGYGTGGAPVFAGRSVTGGYVYRGPLTELQGMYVFGDWSSRQMWAMQIDRNANGGLGALVPGSRIDLSSVLSRQVTGGGAGLGVTSFGEDEIGNLYYLQLDGNLFKIAGRGDVNRDSLINVADVSALMTALSDLSSYQATTHGTGGGALTQQQLLAIADLDNNGAVTNADIQSLINLLASGGGTGSLTPVPEPATLILALLGFSVMSADRLRWRPPQVRGARTLA